MSDQEKAQAATEGSDQEQTPETEAPATPAAGQGDEQPESAA